MAPLMVLCNTCGQEKEWPQHLKNRRHLCCAGCWADKVRNYRMRNVEKALLLSARSRAKAKGLPFNLTVSDIVIPRKCPILGRRLHVGRIGDDRRSFAHPYSPSLDRIVPKRGYVRGNVRVISHRANTIRGDATDAEIRKLNNYLNGGK